MSSTTVRTGLLGSLTLLCLASAVFGDARVSVAGSQVEVALTGDEYQRLHRVTIESEAWGQGNPMEVVLRSLLRAKKIDSVRLGEQARFLVIQTSAKPRTVVDECNDTPVEYNRKENLVRDEASYVVDLTNQQLTTIDAKLELFQDRDEVGLGYGWLSVSGNAFGGWSFCRALDLKSGEALWSRYADELGVYRISTVSFDGGRVLVRGTAYGPSEEDVTVAFDLRTGARLANVGE